LLTVASGSNNNSEVLTCIPAGFDFGFGLGFDRFGFCSFVGFGLGESTVALLSGGGGRTNGSSMQCGHGVFNQSAMPVVAGG